MGIAWGRRLVALGAVVTAISAFGGQTPEQRQPPRIAFDDTVQVLSQIAKTADLLRNYTATTDERSAIQKQIGRIKDGAGSLEGKLQRSSVSDAFYRTLQGDALALARVNGGRPPAGEAIETTTGVADDLWAKAEYMGRPTASLPSDATVEAHTKNGTKDENGYRVWYVARGLARDPSEYRTFPQVSSPSVYQLPPGAYLMWTRRPNGGAEGTKTPFDIGSSGQAKTTVDLPVPPGGPLP